jgi:hypothetical protein
MKINKQTKTNLKTVLQSSVIIPVVWFATFGDNQMCINFTYFFNFFVCVILFAFLGSFDKIKKDLTKDSIPNKYLHFVAWIIPVFLFIADGWITSAIIWFLAWFFAKYRFSEFLKEQNDQQNNNT